MVQKKGVGMSKLLSAGVWVPLFLFENYSFPELLLVGGRWTRGVGFQSLASALEQARANCSSSCRNQTFGRKLE